MTVRVLIADDHSMVRQSLRMYFEGDPDIEIVGEARDGREAVILARNLYPRVILMDILMPVMDGIRATSVIRKELPGTEIVAMTSVMEDSAVPEAVSAGAIAYVLKDTRPQELRHTLLAASAGQVTFSPESADRLMRGVVTSNYDSSRLDEGERALLTWLSHGLSNREIEDKIGATEQEVQEQVQSILDKLQIAGRAQAVLYAIQEGLVAESEVPAIAGSSVGENGAAGEGQQEAGFQDG